MCLTVKEKDPVGAAWFDRYAMLYAAYAEEPSLAQRLVKMAEYPLNGSSGIAPDPDSGESEFEKPVPVQEPIPAGTPELKAARLESMEYLYELYLNQPSLTDRIWYPGKNDSAQGGCYGRITEVRSAGRSLR